MIRHILNIPCSRLEMQHFNAMGSLSRESIAMPLMNRVDLSFRCDPNPIPDYRLPSAEDIARHLRVINRDINTASTQKVDVTVEVVLRPLQPPRNVKAYLQAPLLLSPLDDRMVNLFRISLFDKELEGVEGVDEAHFMRDARDTILSLESSFLMNVLGTTPLAIPPETMRTLRTYLNLGADLETLSNLDKGTITANPLLLDLATLKAKNLVASFDGGPVIEAVSGFAFTRMMQARVVARLIPHPLIKAIGVVGVELALYLSKKQALQALDRPISDTSRLVYSAGSRAVGLARKPQS